MIAKSTSMAWDRFTIGVIDSFMVPRIRRARRPCVYLHGAGGNAVELYGIPGLSALLPHFDTIGNKKYVITCPTITELWGNPTCITRIDAAVEYARDMLGASDDPPLLIGASHGATCALTYAANREVAACVVMIPCVDLQAFRVANTFGLRASVDAAWGVTYPAALPVGANPYTTAIDSPVQLWYANNDAVSVNASTYAMSPEIDSHDVGALGHTNASIAAVNTTNMMDFIEEFAP